MGTVGREVERGIGKESEVDGGEGGRERGTGKESEGDGGEGGGEGNREGE